MPRPTTLVLLLSLLLLARATRPRLCLTRTTMPHMRVSPVFSAPQETAVPLRLHYLCAARKRRSRGRFPLLALIPGALGRAFDYSLLARRLARAGFVVAVPYYTARTPFTSLAPVLDAVAELNAANIAKGLRCPANGSFPTTQLLTSLLNFFLAEDAPHTRVRRSADLMRSIIFGHSLGGAVSEGFFNDVCAAVSEPVVPPPVPPISDPTALPRFACEQFKPFTSPKVKVHGLVTFEGFTAESTIAPTEDTFYVAIHSPFFGDEVTFFDGKDFGGRLATVRIADSNHYGPTNFVTENENQVPVCSRVRPPPEDTFTTTEDVQRKVVRSIAKAVVGSFEAFVDGDGQRALTKLERNEKLLVDKVRFF